MDALKAELQLARNKKDKLDQQRKVGKSMVVE